jgi:hypothetical protein
MSKGGGMFEHAARSFRRTSSGGLALDAEGGATIRLQPSPEGLSVESKGDFEGWLLTRGDQPSDGFILLEADTKSESGRTMAPPGAGREPDLRYLLTSDGCLYRIKLRGPRDGRYELQGWEAPGAYLTARPGSSGWTIFPEPAASGLQEIRPLMILFAAEILDSEEPLAGG